MDILIAAIPKLIIRVTFVRYKDSVGNDRSIPSLFNGREYHALPTRDFPFFFCLSRSALERRQLLSCSVLSPATAPAFQPGKLIDHFPRVQHASSVTLENAFKRLFSRPVVFDGRAPAVSFGLDYFPRIVRP